METDGDQKEGSIGVITAVEDLDGEMIDANDIDADKRKEWFDAITDKLRELDGVEDVQGACNTVLNNQTGQIIITLEHTDSKLKEGVKIEANLRSIGQKIPNLLSDSQFVSNYDMMEKPRSLGNGQHNSPRYMIDFWFV